MRRLKLELDELQVESFATLRTAEGTGTVRGHGVDSETCEFNCGAYTCDGSRTCAAMASCMTICLAETADCERVPDHDE